MTRFVALLNACSGGEAVASSDFPSDVVRNGAALCEPDPDPLTLQRSPHQSDSLKARKRHFINNQSHTPVYHPAATAAATAAVVSPTAVTLAG